MMINVVVPLPDYFCSGILGILTIRENENFYKIRASYFNRFRIQASNDLTDYYIIVPIGNYSCKSAFLK